MQPKNRADADPSAQAAARDVPQSQPFRAPGMCPLEVQAGQLSVENKLLPCFQTLWQPNYDPPTHKHTDTPSQTCPSIPPCRQPPPLLC